MFPPATPPPSPCGAPAPATPIQQRTIRCEENQPLVADPELTSLSGARTAMATAQRILGPTFDDLPWYRWWVLQQLSLQPQRPRLCLPTNDECDDKASSAPTDAFMAVWNQTRELILAPGPKTIESIANSLLDLGLVSAKNNYEAMQSVKDLVFSILGWQTMLYKPYFVSAEAQVPECFSILDEMDGYHGETRACLTQSAAYASRKPLPEFLLGFGVMLPPPNYRGFAADDDPDQQKSFAERKRVSPKEMNAHVLKNVCGLRFCWVDSLSCHLEMDMRSGTVFLYRYPSFCAYQLRRQLDARAEPESKQRKSLSDGHRCVLHCCAFERRSSVPWADQEDVTKLLQQVLLSYRLLFGQTKKSREVFRSLRPFARIPPDGHDEFLTQLCGRKRPPDGCAAEILERDEYDLVDDFPYLRSKLVRLSSYASGKRPQSIMQLWADRRNSPAWLAFWSVLLFGSIGLFLALVQTLFQILQYVDAVKHSGNG